MSFLFTPPLALPSHNRDLEKLYWRRGEGLDGSLHILPYAYGGWRCGHAVTAQIDFIDHDRMPGKHHLALSALSSAIKPPTSRFTASRFSASCISLEKA